MIAILSKTLSYESSYQRVNFGFLGHYLLGLDGGQLGLPCRVGECSAAPTALEIPDFNLEVLDPLLGVVLSHFCGLLDLTYN